MCAFDQLFCAEIQHETLPFSSMLRRSASFLDLCMVSLVRLPTKILAADSGNVVCHVCIHSVVAVVPASRYPATRLPSFEVLGPVHLVNCFKCEILTFEDEEIDHEGSGQIASNATMIDRFSIVEHIQLDRLRLTRQIHRPLRFRRPPMA